MPYLRGHPLNWCHHSSLSLTHTLFLYPSSYIPPFNSFIRVHKKVSPRSKLSRVAIPLLLNLLVLSHVLQSFLLGDSLYPWGMKLNHYQYLSSVLLARFIYTNGSNTKEPGEGLGENEMTIHFLLIRFNSSIL